MSNSWHHARALWRAAEERPCASRGAVMTLRRHYAEPGIVERMAAFEAFIDVTDHTPFVWGKADCSLLVADWVVANGHDDPAADWRGTYDDEASCKALLDRCSGLLTHVSDCAEAVGLVPIREPEFGAIAVIGSLSSVSRQWAAIWNGARWMVKWGDEQSARWTPFAASHLGMWRV